MLHHFSDSEGFFPEEFTDPFRYHPHPLVRKAAAEVLDRLNQWKSLPTSSPLKAIEQSFAEGKMLGVLVCRNKWSEKQEMTSLCYISAFSGTVRNAEGTVTASVEGFVPPIIDLTIPDGYFKIKEEEISEINSKISELSSSSHLAAMRARLKESEHLRDREIQEMQTHISFSKIQRNEIRSETTDPNIHSSLIRESQYQKAELKRLKDRWKETIDEINREIAKAEEEIRSLKSLRTSKSDSLQRWIFENAFVQNFLGDSRSIWEVFKEEGVTPPGGTGDCAAPKLLEYAYNNNLTPLAMGEFWYGKSPDTAVRTHGHFYPSCTSKCGPLLKFMIKGLKTETSPAIQEVPVIIHEDADIIIVEKPSGMPSVPGLDGKTSLQEYLSDRTGKVIHSVHRLDMDTSGIMVFAKTQLAAVNLRKQFEEHTVSKTYMARISSDPQNDEGFIATGEIHLPLSPDYDERPRQKVDFKQGKPAHTKYEVIQKNIDGTTDLLLYPTTGRTHQLRVHCAHHLGLCSPILGDLLYGSAAVSASSSVSTAASRLCLHALSIRFRHPSTDEIITFTSDITSYQ